MKNKKTGCGIVILLIIALLSYFFYRLDVKETRNLGDLSNACNNKFAINITHFSEFDQKQALFFKVKKNGKVIPNLGGQFEITNNMDESIDSFEIHCYDDILYVTWKKEFRPVIIFDTKTLKSYHHNSDDIQNKKELFDRIKRGNNRLQID